MGTTMTALLTVAILAAIVLFGIFSAHGYANTMLWIGMKIYDHAVNFQKRTEERKKDIDARWADRMRTHPAPTQKTFATEID